MRQARADLAMARNAATSGNFEWSCFAAQQAAEKALKSLGLRRGIELWGHSVAAILLEIEPALDQESPLVEAAKQLDHHYIPSRYPNGLPAGAPTDLYTRSQAVQ
ncbi:MAG TPA: HEPN domain-containing protein, partial [Thermoanaerobaculia bacterium]|nr:HEPN domain-containing protein [Thermoanaerobaculia bacterium]